LAREGKEGGAGTVATATSGAAVPTENSTVPRKREILAQSLTYDDPFEEDDDDDYYFNAAGNEGGAFSLTFETEELHQEAENIENDDDGYGFGATCRDIEFEDHEDYANYQEWIWSEDNIKPDEWGTTDQLDRYRAWRRALSPVSPASLDPWMDATEESEIEAGTRNDWAKSNPVDRSTEPSTSPTTDQVIETDSSEIENEDDNLSVPGLGSMSDSSDYFSDWSTSSEDSASSDETVVKTRSRVDSAVVTIGTAQVNWPTFTWDMTAAVLHASLMQRPNIEVGADPIHLGLTAGPPLSTENGNDREPARGTV
jgi:hypothetical protein